MTTNNTLAERGGEEPVQICPSCDGTGVDLWRGTLHDCPLCCGRKVIPLPSPPNQRGGTGEEG